MRALLLCLLASIALAADLPYCRLTVRMGDGQEPVKSVGWWDARHHLLFGEEADPFGNELPDDRILKIEPATGRVPKQPDYIAKAQVRLAKEDAEKAKKEAAKPAPTPVEPVAPKPHRGN